MSDYIVRAIDGNNTFRVMAAVTGGLVETARQRHDTWPVATAALGRALTGCLLLGANLKGDDLITLRIMGDGPLGAVVVTANARGEVRGYVQEPHVDLPREIEGKLPVGQAVGNGLLFVTRNMGLKEPFTGSVELVSGEIARDIAHYLTVSEQTPSAVSLGVLLHPDGRVRSSGGFWLEVLPGAPENVLIKLESNINKLPPVSSLVAEGKTPEQIIELLAEGFGVKYLAKSPVTFSCPCNKNRIEEILISLGMDEIKGLITEQGGAEVRCHFCGEYYNFDIGELNRLLEEMGS